MVHDDINEIPNILLLSYEIMNTDKQSNIITVIKLLFDSFIIGFIVILLLFLTSSYKEINYLPK